MKDNLVKSPDEKGGAYVCTASGYRTNIWVINLATKEAYNFTDTALTRPNVINDESSRRPFQPS